MNYLLLLQHLREITGGILDSFMLILSSLGEPVVTFGLLAWMYWCVDKKLGSMMIGSTSLACTYSQVGKAFLKVERPWVVDERIHPVEAALPGASGYSFPSGHTTRATAVWGALSWKQKSHGLAICGMIIAVLVAFSRNYLGVHTVWDVVAGFGLAAAGIVLSDLTVSWCDHKENRDYFVAVVGCVVLFLPMLKVGCMSNAGAGMGLLIGWSMERHFVRFDIEEELTSKMIRFIPGMLTILLVLKLLPTVLGLFMQAKYAGFFANFLLGIFITLLYPFVFSHRKRYLWGMIAAVLFLIGCLAGGYLAASHTDTNATQENSQEKSEVVVTPAYSEAAVVEVIGHRGYAGAYPENTISSFRGAIEMGVDYIELDVQLTRDGEVVVFHDNDLGRITGCEGTVADYTLEELKAMDFGAYFSPSYVGEQIPTLAEVLELASLSESNVYLELKNIGEVEGFVDKVVAIVSAYGMQSRCLFASFYYPYLEQCKNLDRTLTTLYITTSAVRELPQQYPAEYYGLYIENVTTDTIASIHDAGSKAFVWTADTPEEMCLARNMGIDGVVTNEVGVANVVLRPEYQELADRYEASVTMPFQCGHEADEIDKTMVPQGLTKVGTQLIISAYSKDESQNSVLYVLNGDGSLIQRIDLGFQAHVGGIAYDESHDLLWSTGAEGHVYGIVWSTLQSDGEVKTVCDFDAGLVNHNGVPVASFLTYDHGELYVGSYVNGSNGQLKRYDITDITNPIEVSEYVIPERIQGITFRTDGRSDDRYMLLSQGYQTEDSCLLTFFYQDEADAYLEPEDRMTLPEGAEQIQMTAKGLYVLFESGAIPYRATSRIVNDQIYLLRIE